MKKLFSAALVLLVAFSVNSAAQVKWGVTGGMNFNTSKLSEVDVKAKTGWNAGVTCLIDLPLGFSIQPSLVYSQKGVNVTDKLALTTDNLELPVAIQWGPDLLAFRPFVDVSPFVGYTFTNKVGDANVGSGSWKDNLSYGIGLGAGINVWKFQLIAKYCWNFGSLDSLDEAKDQIAGIGFDNKNFGGLNLSVAFLF